MAANTATVRADMTAGVAFQAMPGRLWPKLVYSADSPDADAPAILEPSAPPYSVAFHRGYMRLAAGQAKQAVADFEEAIKFKRDFFEAYVNLGVARAMMGHAFATVDAFKKVVELKPKFSDVYLLLGWALARTNRWEDAIVAYRKAIELRFRFRSSKVIRVFLPSDPFDFYAQANLAVAHAKIGHFKEALLHTRGAAVFAKDDFLREELDRFLEDIAFEAAQSQHEIESFIVSLHNSYMPNHKPLQFDDSMFEIASRYGLSAVKAHEALRGAARPPRMKAKPRALWDDREGADAKLTPPQFIAKHYAAEMAAGTLHRGMIGQEDKPLAVKLANWLRTHPMPEGVDIPTLPEWNTRQLAKLEDGEFERLARLHEVAKTRRRKLAVPAAV